MVTERERVYLIKLRWGYREGGKVKGGDRSV
jgi:hypothetical protein